MKSILIISGIVIFNMVLFIIAVYLINDAFNLDANVLKEATALFILKIAWEFRVKFES